jgi:hypothetical protein
MIGHRRYLGRPDEDEAATGGVRVHTHTDLRSGPSRGPGRRERLLLAPTV